MKSTMGAPLSDHEVQTILEAWRALCASTLRHDCTEPVEMLDPIAEIISRAHAARSAISNGWHYANRRAFPDPPRGKAPSERVRASSDDFNTAMIDEIIALIKEQDK